MVLYVDALLVDVPQVFHAGCPFQLHGIGHCGLMLELSLGRRYEYPASRRLILTKVRAIHNEGYKCGPFIWAPGKKK